MRKKNVIILGDSFVYGHGCSDREYYVDLRGKQHGDLDTLDLGPSVNCWASLLATELQEQINVTNLSLPGVDNQSLLSSLCNFLDNNDNPPDLIMFNTCPGGRMLIADHVPATIYLDKTPQFFTKLINLEDLTKSAAWRKVFKKTKVSSIMHSKDDVLTNFAGKYYHTALDVQTIMSVLLSIYCISQSYSAKFLWAPNIYCNTETNLDLIPAPLRRPVIDSRVQHISKFQTTDPNSFMAVDGHVNDMGHATYFKTIMLPRIKAELGLT